MFSIYPMFSFDTINKLFPTAQQWRWYGIAAISLKLYGSHTVWLLQAQIIGELQDEDAISFKKMAYDECTMIAVAAAIVAQIAITGLSLDSLNKTHWTTKSCFVMSLTFALVSVYYSVTQQRILGRLIKAKDVRHWIRGRKQAVNRIFSMEVSFKLDPCEPDDYSPEDLNIRDFKRDFERQCFLPSPLSVITLSAPQMLLSGSLSLLLIGLGIYLGKFWIRELDPTEPAADSRNVFILYFIGLYFSGGMYVVLGWFHGSDKRSESEVIDGYVNRYLSSHADVLSRWNVDRHWGFQDGILKPISSTEIDNTSTVVQNEMEGMNNV
ncbi:hypothetical protein BCIN_08g01250 [Botrytis cinerea B05.10]|uniref:Uncharacterized protein n=2 Tax=Botryotinia fuckeliana TaxID=40559 RepID=A0A384JPF5_BOTFB|nr:hypothetical protein BCIN_08g01250 [Botrytis cinerea B05.10]ATZ52382.1 hypothetical protein BCIN_08g01250 [Botrytis cinerea B05.10]